MKKQTIMVVEDQFFLAEMIRARLEFLGYNVLYAENGAKALEVLGQNSVDLMIMDVMMPVMDGLEAARQIRSQEKWQKMPIIFLTARAREEDKQQVLTVGGNDYLAKPFESVQLVELVQKWLGK